MKKIENYKVSEETLAKVAGGLKMPNITLKNALIGTGIAILTVSGATAVAVGGTLGVKKYNKLQKEKANRAKYAARHNKKYMSEQNSIANIDANYFTYKSKEEEEEAALDNHPVNIIPNEILYPHPFI